MIRRYDKIALLYGQSTKNIATKFEGKINALHNEMRNERYPIEAVMCDDSAFRQNVKDEEIADVIRTKFEDVVHAFVFLGCDDFALPIKEDMRETSLESVIQNITNVAFSKTATLSKKDFSKCFNEFQIRASQNVILETGLIWGQIGNFNNITFITTFPFSDLKFQKYSLPSDIPILTKYVISLAEDKTLEIEIDKLIKDKLLEGGLQIAPYKNLCNDEGYIVDYKNFFSPKQLIEINGQKLKDIDKENKLTHREQFEYIIELWNKDLHSLKYDDERIIYIFERLVFLSYFHKDKQQGFKWAKNALNSIIHKPSNYHEILNQVLEYIKAKGEENNSFFNFKKIADNLLTIKSQLSRLNPVIEVYLNDYIGLACRMTVIEFRKDESVDNDFIPTDYLKNALVALNRCIDLEFHSAYEAATLWRGYSLYNRARIYSDLSLYSSNESKKKEYKLKSEEDLKGAVNTRYEWLALDSLGAMPNVFENAFISEYVIATLDAITANVIVKDSVSERLKDLYKKLSLASSAGLNLVSFAKKRLENSGIGDNIEQITKKMLADNMPIDNIAKYTGLSFSEIKSLQ